MDNNMMNVPAKIVEGNIKAAVDKANMPIWRLIILGIFAGMFIAGGAAGSSVTMHATANVGLSRFLGGCIFPVGLMMIVFIGGELFTGDCMMIMGAMDKKYSYLSVIKVLIIVWLSNFIGAVLVSYMVSESGQFGYSDGLLGAFTIKVALGKVNLSFMSALWSGVMCNIFVCAAVLMAAAAKDVAGKVWAIFFPILAFVVSGYEHCVANMYYIPAGIMAMSNKKYVNVAKETYGYTAEQLDKLNWDSFLVDSAIPVTLGNIVGGMVFIGIPLYILHKKNINNNN